MAKFYDEIGYAETVETVPGVYEDVITARKYYGDVLRNTRSLDSGDKVNNDISVGNSISILADAYAYQNFHKVKYITWMGTRWLAKSIEVKAPRMIFSLGGIYNGD